MAQLNMPVLTIAIPTYNRPAQLLNTLSKLLPQLNDKCYLSIIDNHSDVPATERTAELLGQYPNVKYKIHRNHVNIGGDSNIIRCFEYCDTPWLWTVGDDDEILPTAIETIFADIAAHPDVTSINYCSPAANRPARQKASINYGREEFLANTDSFGSLIYITCNIYQTKHLTAYGHWLANNNTYSCVSQWIILFQSLTKDSKTIFSDKAVCTNPVVTTGAESANIMVIQGVSTLLDMRISYREKQLLIDCFKRDLYNFVSPESLFRTVTMQYIATGDKNYLFIFKRLYYTFYKYLGFKIGIKFFVYYNMLAVAPNLTFKLIRNRYLKMRGIDLNDFVKKQ
jgi:glycosyltransferase involved in cell wall biosynthesis